MRKFNSTIKIKTKKCIACNRDSIIFSRGRCVDCTKRFRIFEQEEKEVVQYKGLSGLIADADALVSRYVIKSNSDKSGQCQCFTCQTKKHYTMMQCGHYISRKHLYLRWDLRNLRPQCQDCNEYKHGNLLVFARKLEDENFGITEILLEESRIIYKPTRNELQAIISDFGQKLR